MILAGATLLGGVIQGRMSPPLGQISGVRGLGESTAGTAHGNRPLAHESVAVPEPGRRGRIGVRRLREPAIRKSKRRARVVTVAVLLGPAGPISVHTPDVCYSSQEYYRPRIPRTDPVRRRRRLAGRTVEHVSPVDESDGRQLARLLRLVHRRPVVGAEGRPFRVRRPASPIQASSGRTVAVATRR